MHFTRPRSCAATALAGVLALLLASPAWADGFIIAHLGIDISAADIREVYLGEKQFAGVLRLIPVHNSAAEAEFLSKVIKFDAAKYATAWTKKTFRDGINPPASRSSDADTVAFVRHTPGAIGYVTSSPPGNVKLVQKY